MGPAKTVVAGRETVNDQDIAGVGGCARPCHEFSCILAPAAWLQRFRNAPKFQGRGRLDFKLVSGFGPYPASLQATFNLTTVLTGNNVHPVTVANPETGAAQPPRLRPLGAAQSAGDGDAGLAVPSRHPSADPARRRAPGAGPMVRRRDVDFCLSFRCGRSRFLLNNLIYNVSEIAIPFDNVDPETVLKPLKWDIKLIERFMLVFGPVSSVFDFMTYAMLAFFHAGEALFQTGWLSSIWSPKPWWSFASGREDFSFAESQAGFSPSWPQGRSPRRSRRGLRRRRPSRHPRSWRHANEFASVGMSYRRFPDFPSAESSRARRAISWRSVAGIYPSSYDHAQSLISGKSSKFCLM